MISESYGTDALFYTVGYNLSGSDHALATLNPTGGNVNDTNWFFDWIDWFTLNEKLDDEYDPYNGELNYTDGYYTGTLSSVSNVFEGIVNQVTGTCAPISGDSYSPILSEPASSLPRRRRVRSPLRLTAFPARPER